MRLGAAQMFIADSLAANLAKIARMAREAASRGVELLVFPEMCLTGYNPRTIGRTGFAAELDEALGKLGRWSAKWGLGLVVGRAAWVGEKLFNAASVFLPDGTMHTYYKMHLTAVEERYFAAGTAPLVFSYRGHRFGVLICRDQNYPELARSLKEKGAETLLILSAHYYSPGEARWKVDKNRALPIARAVENHCYVLLANAVGCHLGLVSLGNSLIVDPEGAVVSSADESSEVVITCDLVPPACCGVNDGQSR